MAITRKSSTDFAAILERAIKQRNSSYDTAVGPIRDLYIEPTAAALEIQSNAIYQVQQLLTLANGASFTAADLDAFVYNESMVRNKGGRAKVILTFQRPVQLVASDVTVRAGFAVSTMADETTGATVTFIVDADTTMYVDSINSYVVNINGSDYYQLKVPATASVSGATGNVGPYRVVRMLRQHSFFTSAFNEASASGGTDQETNSELIRRYLTAIVGSSPSVVSGIEKIIRSNFSEIIDMNIVYGNSPYNVRSASDGGAVDVYIIGEQQVPVVEYVTYTGPAQVLKLSRQPVVSITDVLDTVNPSSISYVQDPGANASYKLVKDTGSYAGSDLAGDGVYFFPAASVLPTLGSQVQVKYKYNALPSSMKAEFSKPDRDVPGRSMLFKEATQVDIVIDARIKVRSGFNVDSIKGLVNQAINDYINALKLGEDIELSDLQAVARRFTGVDNFIIDSLYRVGSSGAVDLAIGPFEYARIASGDLTITDLL